MPAKRKGAIPPHPNYEANSLDVADHVCSLHTVEPKMPDDLRKHLEEERDHYLGTALVAGLDPVSKKEVVFPGSDRIEALLNKGIDACCALAAGDDPVHASIHVHRHDPKKLEPTGDELRVSVTVA
jgi:hypothetical protein